MLPFTGHGLIARPNDMIDPANCGHFNYLFPDAEGVPYTDETAAALTALQIAMEEPNAVEEVVARFRPVCSLIKVDQGFISGC